MIGIFSDLSSESFFFSTNGGVGLDTMTGGGADMVDSLSLLPSSTGVGPGTSAELSFDISEVSDSANDTAESLEINDKADGVGEGDGVCMEDNEPMIGLEAALTNPG